MKTFALDARKWQDGGIGRYIRALARHLPAELPGVERRLLIRPEDRDAVAAAAPDWRLEALPVRLYSLTELSALERVTRQLRIDLLHVPHWTVPARAFGRRVTTIHDAIQIDPRYFGLAKRMVARTMIRRALRVADAAITDSASSKRDLVRAVGSAGERLRVVACGCELPPERDRAELGSRARVPKGAVVAIWSPKPHKRLVDLIAARALMAPAERPPLVLACGERDEPARAWLADLGSFDGIELVAGLGDDDLQRLFAAAAVVVSPSTVEGFGLAVLEGLAAGVRVLASEIPAHREVAGDAARYFPAGDARALADALLAAVATPPTREETERGRARARELSWAATAAATARVYRELA